MRNSLTPTRKTSQKRTEEDSPDPSLPLPRRKPFLLLHICCGPCSTHVIDLLEDKYHPIGFFYNPNLHPTQEYFRRLEAAAQVCGQHRVALWVPPFGQEAWLDEVEGLGGEPEGGRRCNICIRLRLEATAWVARAASMAAFATTLTISPRKNSHVINTLGNDLSRSYDISFLEADFKKKDGFLKSVKKSRDMGLYRQDYCGCCYSMRGGSSPPEDHPG
ncbi:MAG: epoxyqueuosine reductase QueH [Thermodesulfobacteriota bacterium]